MDQSHCTEFTVFTLFAVFTVLTVFTVFLHNSKPRKKECTVLHCPQSLCISMHCIYYCIIDCILHCISTPLCRAGEIPHITAGSNARHDRLQYKAVYEGAGGLCEGWGLGQIGAGFPASEEEHSHCCPADVG